jgi:hypothetical protein
MLCKLLKILNDDYKIIFFFYRKNQNFGNYEVIKSPGHVVLEPRCIPSNIMKPPYTDDVNFKILSSASPEIKSNMQIECMRASCGLARSTLKYAKELVKVSLNQLIRNW